jgi:predicted alpha-1,2-mannosidase
VAISYVSIENAKANIEAESPLTRFSSADFDQAVQNASHIWNEWLNRIQVNGGSMADRRTFYSMFYHALLAPTIVSDANGEYLGYDGNVHKTENSRAQYGYFSGWDIYRSECQFLAMIAPKDASDMAQSLLNDYQQGGAFPRWGLATQDSGVMNGDPSAPIIAGFYAFGATNFDAKAALAGLIRAATDPSVMAPRSKIFERDALADYLKLGYVPEDQHGIWGGYGNVATTLEFASADFAVSQLAQALGDETNNAMLLKHAQNWRNLYNHDTGYLQMRRRDGTWAPGFTNNVLEYDRNRAYQEGTAAQFVWMVPFNLKGLTEAMGGQDLAAARLDTFFTELNAGAKSTFAYLGNEPCLETPWIYCFLGQPYKAQQVARRAIKELYSSAPDGYPGNDDLGEMSSWYLFAALGMYPEIPGSDVLVLNSPLFPKAVLHLAHGDVTIEANGTAEGAPYIQSLTVNGKAWNKPWIRFSDISHGGRLVYQLGATPNTKWGNDTTNAPPSYE